MNRHDRQAAWSGVHYASGYGLSVVASLILAVILPRALGLSDYGRWVFYRGVINVLSYVLMLGAPEIFARIYVGLRARGETIEARRVMKAVFLVRLAAGVLSAAAGAAFFLWVRSDFIPIEQVWLPALSILFQHTVITCVQVLYSERRSMRMALFGLLQATAAPAAVAAAYAWRGFEVVPAACALGDGLLLAAVLAMAAPHLRWTAGWPTRERCRGMLHFGGMISVAGLGLNIYLPLGLVTLGLLGVPPEALGMFGLATRCSRLLQRGLISIAHGLMPFMTAAYEKFGLEAALRRQSLLLRFGLLVQIVALGVFMTAGRPLVRLVWGESYRALWGVMALCLSATVPHWIAYAHSQCLWLKYRGGAYLVSVLGLLIVFLGLLFVFEPAHGALGAALALALGDLTYLYFSRVAAGRYLGRKLELKGAWVGLFLVLPFTLLRGGDAEGFSSLWGTGLFLGVVALWTALGGGALRGEFSMLFRMLFRREET